MTRAAAWLPLVALAVACGEPTVAKFPRFTETQNEWLQSHCRITYVGVLSSDTRLADAKAKLHADIVERLASSMTEVQLVAYACPVAVPDEVAKGEE